MIMKIAPNQNYPKSHYKQRKTLAGKGELKIFLGMAAGVGKTYAMLSEQGLLKEKESMSSSGL